MAFLPLFHSVYLTWSASHWHPCTHRFIPSFSLFSEVLPILSQIAISHSTFYKTHQKEPLQRYIFIVHTKVFPQLWTLSFIGAPYRSRDDPKTAVSPKPTPGWVRHLTKLKSWTILHSLQAAQHIRDRPFRVPQWPKPPQAARLFLLLPGSWSGSRVFAARLPSVWTKLSAFTANSDRKGLSKSGKFQDLPEVTFELFTFLFRELSCRMECFNLWAQCCTIACLQGSI